MTWKRRGVPYPAGRRGGIAAGPLLSTNGRCPKNSEAFPRIQAKYCCGSAWCEDLAHRLREDGVDLLEGEEGQVVGAGALLEPIEWWKGALRRP